MLKKIILIAMLTLFAATTVLAAEGTSTLYGAVNDNGQPLANSLVTIIGESSYHSGSTTTNERGVYVFDKLPADEYIIRAIPQPAGVYKDGAANVFVGKGKKKEVNFSMEKK
ncbi:carboxypeptidase-like regulatory domain-containing protein [Pseudodesulfovibrio sp.]|nr:carboxypeptidase-like regulatory domain-containing protein [Pseudodesulfovibrio sp.]